MIYDQLMRALQKNQEEYAELNNRLATEKKILKPSDDVMGTVRAMDYRVSITSNDQYMRNIDGATNNLKLTDTVLTSLSDTLSKIKELALGSMSGTTDPDIQAAYARQAGQLRDHLYEIANTKVGDRYLFAGFRTNQQPYAAGTYNYQGDNGIINSPIDRGAAIPINVTGNETFSYTLAAPYVKQISSGLNVHYTPGAGTTVNVEIRDAADTVVLDTFSYSNVMQMTDLLGSAISANDRSRIEALIDPLNGVRNQVVTAQSDVGARLSSLKDQSYSLTLNTNTLKDVLSSTEDADMTETAMQLQKANTTLQALYASSSRILSQSLLDFLK
jgi:flagellar hook-associated protein 3 FlgL